MKYIMRIVIVCLLVCGTGLILAGCESDSYGGSSLKPDDGSGPDLGKPGGKRDPDND